MGTGIAWEREGRGGQDGVLHGTRWLHACRWGLPATTNTIIVTYNMNLATDPRPALPSYTRQGGRQSGQWTPLLPLQNGEREGGPPPPSDIQRGLRTSDTLQSSYAVFQARQCCKDSR